MTTNIGYPLETPVEERIILALPPVKQENAAGQEHPDHTEGSDNSRPIYGPPAPVVFEDTNVAELLLDYMSVKDASIYLDVSTSRIYTMIEKGKFDAVMVEGTRKKWLVSRRDIIEYKRYRKVGMPSFPRVSRYVPHSPQDHSRLPVA